MTKIAIIDTETVSMKGGDCDDYNYEGSWEETLGGDFY